MDNRAEVREFLTTRRAKITPDQAGPAEIGDAAAASARRCLSKRAFHTRQA
jgi:hypothetical protein